MNIKVMTFNLRVPAESDGVNYFPNRKERILSCIAKEDPDLIGFQEASDEGRALLRDALSDRYVLLGCGRQKGYRGESTPIAYRKDLFELVNLSTRFLSDTPTVPGSRYANSDQSVCPRLFVHAELSAEGGAGTVHFINTHLDHKGRESRFLGMKQILDYAEGMEGPVILTGDMNARPDEACISLAKERGLSDTTEEILHTFHGFGKFTEEEKYKIDYIFTNAPFEKARRVDDEPVDGVYISDHHTVVATVEI
ncbi:MAG: endonuclease/exonuclease/phosphatase family protein [Clostridia bacterium]|nr:endonuclease/exonuclease/phosphatase family protein [Clostridia bacterium]